MFATAPPGGEKSRTLAGIARILILTFASVAVPVASNGQYCTPVTSSTAPASDIITMYVGSACEVTATGITSDGAGTLTTQYTVNAGALNLLPPTYSGTPPVGIGLVSVTLKNSTLSGAPTTNSLACWDTSLAGTVTACSVSNTTVIGVTYNNSVTTGGVSYSQIVRMGSIPCAFGSPPTAGHYVIAASTGACSDSSSSSYPTTSQPVGVVLSGSGSSPYLIFAMNDLPTPGAVFAGATCLTPAGNIRCYGEFPWVFKDGVRMMFEGSYFTSAATIDKCYNTGTCQPNYDDEWLQNQIFTDFSRSTFPMTLVAAAPMTNYNVYGTGDCAAILWDQHSTPATTYCGLFDATSARATYGGCSRMDIDEASQTAACANQTSHNEPDTNLASPLQRSMVISFAGATGNGVITANPTAIFNQAVQALGGTVVTSGIVIAAQ